MLVIDVHLQSITRFKASNTERAGECVQSVDMIRCSTVSTGVDYARADRIEMGSVDVFFECPRVLCRIKVKLNLHVRDKTKSESLPVVYGHIKHIKVDDGSGIVIFDLLLTFNFRPS